jgi:hypothetical protein
MHDKESTMDTKRIISFATGAAIGLALGSGVALATTAQAPQAPAAVSPEQEPASGTPAAKASVQGAEAPARKSLVVVLPADRDYVSASSIAVAGTAFGRPHGPRVGSVRVELLVGGQLIEEADLAVHSSRFAGVLDLPAPMARTEAELRVSDPKRPSAPAVIRRLTIGGTSP